VGPARIGGVARQVDIFPTLLEAIGASLPEGPPPIEGRSLLPALRGEADRAPAAMAFSTAGNPSNALYAVQDARHKLIVPADGKVQLYDLARDPGERADLAASDAPLRERWRELAVRELERLTQDAAGVPAPGVTDEHAEQLRALGYAE
jgi:choline-sulfatase